MNDWEKVGASGRPHKVVLPEKEKDHPVTAISNVCTQSFVKSFGLLFQYYVLLF